MNDKKLIAPHTHTHARARARARTHRVCIYTYICSS